MVILTNFFSDITNNNNYFSKSCTEQLVQKSSSSKTDGGISTSFVESQKFAGKKLSIGINSSLPIGITLQSVRSWATSSQQVKSPLSLLVLTCPPLHSSSFDLQFEQCVWIPYLHKGTTTKFIFLIIFMIWATWRYWNNYYFRLRVRENLKLRPVLTER